MAKATVWRKARDVSGLPAHPPTRSRPQPRSCRPTAPCPPAVVLQFYSAMALQNLSAVDTAVRAARVVGLQPTDNLDLFGPGGQINYPDRLRALIDAVVTQEVGASHCPQPPHGETWIGCRVGDDIYSRVV